MAEKAARSLRRKPNSSLGVATQLHKERQARRDLQRRQHRRGGGDRAARPRPARDGVAARRSPRSSRTAARARVVLDVGANADVQAAATWSSSRTWARCYARYLLGLENPRVGLLSIGEEDDQGQRAACSRRTRSCAPGAAPQLHRQRRGPRHVQGHVRRGRDRRLHRQRACSRPPRAWPSYSSAASRARCGRSLLAKLGRAAACKPALDRLQARRSTGRSTARAPLLGVNGVCFIGHGTSGPARDPERDPHARPRSSSSASTSTSARRSEARP